MKVLGNTACLLLFSALILNRAWREAGTLYRDTESLSAFVQHRDKQKELRAERRKWEICSNNHQKSCILNALLRQPWGYKPRDPALTLETKREVPLSSLVNLTFCPCSSRPRLWSKWLWKIPPPWVSLSLWDWQTNLNSSYPCFLCFCWTTWSLWWAIYSWWF